MEIEEWRALVDFWRGQKRDLKYLDIPAAVARQLDIPMEDSMTTEEPNTETAPSGEVPSDSAILKFKKKKYFPADKCGLIGCSKEADGYAAATKPTGKNPAGHLWFGPACKKCIVKIGFSEEAVVSLSHLAHQRSGASDMALILDVEVGEVLKRLKGAGIDDNGRPCPKTAIVPPTGDVMNTQPVPTVEAGLGEEPVWTPPPPAPEQQPAATEVVTTPQGSVALTVAAVHVPVAGLVAEMEGANSILATVMPFHIHTQDAMDLAGGLLADVKGAWKRLDAARKALGAPLRERLKEIQDHYTPTLDVLGKAEGLLKVRMQEGESRAQHVQAAALVSAQQAYQAGDPAAMAQATQAAVGADVTLPQGVTARMLKKWRIVDASQVPLELYSIDAAKIQAAVEAGHTAIPGIEIYEEPSLAARAS